ncbi:hypothetical protein PV682_24055 [Streptomyces niveiscabiei]|uniref:hypothetical protein n=1 Tax=Streptomyces niveiscabiei TaxID=164115 RepID=UPI0029BA0EB2|nr:hypothetical protein [Streptomyces niveiscabiei]MDX3384514.1 hypothetical protein [Streptomyces niveiscabiei]
MRTPRSYSDRIAHRAAAGAVEGVVEEVLRAAVVSRGVWHAAWAEIPDRLAALPADRRRDLLRALAERYPELDGPNRLGPGVIGARTEIRCGVLVLSLRVAGADLPDPLAPARAPALADLARRRAYRPWARYDLLAEAELSAGRALAPAVVAVLRRTALDAPGEEQPGRLVAGLTDPVLDVGEQWAESAMADAGLRPVLVHALRAKGSRPTAKWDTEARSLIETLGADRIRAAVHTWFTQVGRPRTLPLEYAPFEPDADSTYDPHNAVALRGLAWLLSLLPPDTATVRALVALVETSLDQVPGVGPRGAKVANAGVLALGRTGAVEELRRLEGSVTHRGTAKVLRGVLAG